MLVFLAYYGLLMTGETLADDLVISPLVGMWSANAFLLLMSLLAAWQWRGPTVSRYRNVASLY